MQQAALYRRERQFVVSVVIGFCLRNQRDLRETLGFLCADRLSTLACYSPADSADHAEECSRLHYFAEKDSLVIVVLGFVCVNLQDQREILGFHLCNCLSTLA
jgi:hypothetical protein